jgi:hypothetical protein
VPEPKLPSSTSVLTLDCRVDGTPGNEPSSSVRTLDAISRPIARLPTADDVVLPPCQSYKRKFSRDHKSPLLKKSKTFPLECTKLSSKGKEPARDAQDDDVIQSVYDSLMETCVCPMYAATISTHLAAASLINAP